MIQLNIGERIRRRRKELNYSADYVAEKLGKNRATVYRYESSQIENMPYDIIAELAVVLKVDPSYLMGWKESQEDIVSSHEYNYIPNPVSAGQPLNIEGVTQTDKLRILDSIMGKWAGDEDILMMRVNGDSMNKTIPHNSLIAVKPITLANLKNDDIVVFSNDHEYSVKRFYHDKDKERFIFRPHSNDESFVDNIVTYEAAANLMLHGKVVMYIVEMD